MTVSSLKVRAPPPPQSPLNIFFLYLPNNGDSSSVARSVPVQSTTVKAADEKTAGVALKTMVTRPICVPTQPLLAKRILIPVRFDIIQLNAHEDPRLEKLSFGRWKLVIPNGRLYDLYEGSLYDRKANGVGHCCFANKYFYKGGWKDGKFYGEGTLIDPLGKTLEGFFNPTMNESPIPKMVIITNSWLYGLKIPGTEIVVKRLM